MMPEPVSRRSVLGAAATITAATTTGGWLWQSTSPAAAATPSPGPLDTVILGDSASEGAHAVVATLSQVVTGGLGEPARILNPEVPASYWGGKIAFTVKANPQGTTYLTIKLWGDDRDESVEPNNFGSQGWRLQLFSADGQQIGYEDQGAVDCLDILDTSARTPGRFFYHTLPIPEKLTRGRDTIGLEVRSMGRIWSYGQNQAQLYYNQTTASRGVYRLYTHAEPYFVPHPGDVQGPAPAPAPRAQDIDAAMAKVRARVAADQAYQLTEADPASMDAWAYQQLAEGYLWDGSPAYRQPAALERVCQAIDGRYQAWLKDPAVLTGSDQQWQGFGRVGLVMALLWDDIQPYLALPVTGDSRTLPNPGFENGVAAPSGWARAGWAGDGLVTRDATVAHTGIASMKVVNANAGKTVVVNPTRKTTVEEGKTYEYGAWIKTDGVSGIGAHIDPLFFDVAGKLIGTDTRVSAATGTHDWEYVSVKLTTPAGATQVEFHLRLAEAGTAWFDDITLIAPDTATDPAPVRRDAYITMLAESLSYWRQHFPHYSNQAQICAIGLYQVNRGLRLLAPDRALPEPKARDYLHQSIGTVPYLGPEDADGVPTLPLGAHYTQVTAKGLTRELGYVGNYGEVTDWMIMMYESVSRGTGGSEDDALRKQILKIIKARGYFRIKDVDGDGHTVARIETVVGWRNEVYPGEIAYASRTAWDSHPVMSAAVFRDPELVGWTQEMFADGQFTSQLDLLITYPWTRVGLTALRLVSRDWAAYLALPARPNRLPTNWNAPNFVFSDEEDGVVAIKNGTELLYASLYWRARQAVNGYARIHHVTPTDQRSATIRQRPTVSKAADFTVRDWILWDYAINDPGAAGIPPGGFPPPGDTLHQALAGDVYPVAQWPSDVPDPAIGVHFDGVESLFVGKASFYVCEYGRYIIAMNTTTDRSYRLDTEHHGPARDVASGKRVSLPCRLDVRPLSTLVLYLE
jgi:hypothetical protein